MTIKTRATSWLGSSPGITVLLATVAAVGYASTTKPILVKLVIGAAAVATVALRPKIGVLLLGAVLPFSADVTNGIFGGLSVSMSDLLMVVLLLVLVGEQLSGLRPHDVLPLRSLALTVGPYVGLMLILLAAHLGPDQFIKTPQRLELLVAPLLLGSAIVRWGLEEHLLRAYVVASTLLAAAWFPLQNSVALGQKNPVGQFIANALVLLLAVKSLRRRLGLCIPILAAGLLLTGSRGALVSVPVAAGLLIISQRGVGRARALVGLVPVTVVAFVAWQMLPENLQERNSTFTATGDSSAAWALKIRESFYAEAWQMIHANPWTGVGVGGYSRGLVGGASSQDPHNVLLLQAAEGGYPLAVAFGLLIVGTAILGLIRLRQTQLGPAAVALTVAVACHGLVDVYWVRGTPVLPWLLIGMAFAQSGGHDRVDKAQMLSADEPASVA
jgi:O-antigen ligase